MGIIVNPSLDDGSQKLLLDSWKKKFGNGLNPEQYRVGNEKPILTKNGVLLIDWPKVLHGLDFLMGTAVKPRIDHYPDPPAIAAKMIESGCREYFQKNVRNGLATFQDKEIQALL